MEVTQFITMLLNSLPILRNMEETDVLKAPSIKNKLILLNGHFDWLEKLTASKYNSY